MTIEQTQDSTPIIPHEPTEWELRKRAERERAAALAVERHAEMRRAERQTAITSKQFLEAVSKYEQARGSLQGVVGNFSRMGLAPVAVLLGDDDAAASRAPAEALAQRSGTLDAAIDAVEASAEAFRAALNVFLKTATDAPGAHLVPLTDALQLSQLGSDARSTGFFPAPLVIDDSWDAEKRQLARARHVAARDAASVLRDCGPNAVASVRAWAAFVIASNAPAPAPRPRRHA